MANEYAENIRRIARGDRRRGGLSRQGERDDIEGGSVPLLTNAEIAELNNEQQTPSSNAPENEDKDPEDEEQQDNIDPNDPNSFYRGAQSSTGSQTDEGTYDVGDVIDGTGNAPGSAPGSGGEQNSGALRELTGLKDCETDTPFNLHMDGNFIPPEGWDDPETPPVPEPPEGYEEGFYWYRLDDDTAAPDPVSVYRQIIDSDPTVTWVSGFVASFNAAGDRASVSYTILFVSGGNEDTFIDGADKAECTPSSIDSFPAVATACSWTPEDDAPAAWPEDDTYDLALKDGQLQTSEFDADKPRDESLGTKPFCFGEDRTGEARVTADGGLMVYETGAEGAPIGAATVYDSAGDFAAAGDATETFISQYLPK